MGDQNIVSNSESSPPEKNSPAAADQCTCSIQCSIHPSGSSRPKENHPKPIPIGYRFKPTDAELISHFLINKIRGQQSESYNIQQVKILDFTYEELTEKYKEYAINGSEWYIFTIRELICPDGVRARRDAGNHEGLWKPFGKLEQIEDEQKRVIGTKRTLVYRILNKDSSTKESTNTDIRMDEYGAEIAAVPDTNMECATDIVKPFTDFCLCKIYKQPSKLPGNSYLPNDGDAEEMPFVDPFPWFGNNLSVAEENERWEMELKEENQMNTYFNELPDMDQNDPDFWDFDGQHLLTDQQRSLIRCDWINSPVAAQH
ncbi:hypothetical protein MKX03_036543 [Papaver bracteatum]|nr:hypothetical protein MKX03_036543 [Papaver bracteatum]